MGKGGSNSNTYKYICKGASKEKYNLMLPFNYKYNYNLKYMKIWARNKLKQTSILYWMTSRHRARRGLL